LGGGAARPPFEKAPCSSYPHGVDYQDRTAFDVVIDTNGKTPAEVKAAILAAVEHKTARGDG
jgi:cytidylate kinase